MRKTRRKKGFVKLERACDTFLARGKRVTFVVRPSRHHLIITIEVSDAEIAALRRDWKDLRNIEA